MDVSQANKKVPTDQTSFMDSVVSF